ncbi:hypothetical protein, partial [Gracilimonas sp.]|uniref:hypothetical protein n=1 Tax=Gracilimonas sp. TaxID=1974203 RepID=UPI0028723EE2|nr:hypothetical protein [Gracilimonas sp.]
MEINPDYIQYVHLHDPIEFEKEWMNQWKHKGLTQEEAYKVVEDKYTLCWGEHKYSSFESFYQGWYKRMRKR